MFWVFSDQAPSIRHAITNIFPEQMDMFFDITALLRDMDILYSATQIYNSTTESLATSDLFSLAHLTERTHHHETTMSQAKIWVRAPTGVYQRNTIKG